MPGAAAHMSCLSDIDISDYGSYATANMIMALHCVYDYGSALCISYRNILASHNSCAIINMIVLSLVCQLILAYYLL